MEENKNEMVENRTRDRGMLTGMFRDRESTEHAYNTLHERGYTKDAINIEAYQEVA